MLEEMKRELTAHMNRLRAQLEYTRDTALSMLQSEAREIKRNLDNHAENIKQETQKLHDALAYNSAKAVSIIVDEQIKRIQQAATQDILRIHDCLDAYVKKTMKDKETPAVATEKVALSSHPSFEYVCLEKDRVADIWHVVSTVVNLCVAEHWVSNYPNIRTIQKRLKKT